MTKGPKPRPLCDRVLERLPNVTTLLAPDACWEWQGYVMINGYGKLTHQEQGRSNLAHRLVYECLVGPIPDGLTIDHLCRNRSCVNPEHLEPVSQSQNLIRSPLIRDNNGNRLKTHCKHGHEYTPETTGRDKRGHRWCRECSRIRQRETYWRRKEVGP